MLPAIDRSSALPIYTQLTEWMRAQIASGAWETGFKLTAEAELAEELGLARGTVRKAIGELIAEGLLIRTHGRGTFVAPSPVDQPLAERLVTYSEALIAQGIAFTTDVLEARMIPAGAAMAMTMACAVGDPIFALKRIRWVDDVPAILLHNYVLAQGCPGIELIDFTRYRLFEVLETRYGLRLERGRRFFQALNADDTMAELLDLELGAAVMHLTQTTFLSDGRPVEYSNVWLRGASFRLAASLQRGKQPDMDIMVLTAGTENGLGPG